MDTFLPTKEASPPVVVVDEREGVAVDDLPHLVEKREGEAQIDAAYLV